MTRIDWDEYHTQEIEKWNQQEYVKKIRQKMDKFKPLFNDMPLPEDVSYNDILIASAPNYYGHWGGQFSGPFMELEISGEGFRNRPNIIILHEMIHVHEYFMKPEEKEKLQADLMERLKDPIPDIERIMQDARPLMEQFNGVEPEQLDAHTDLFFLKSLDLDLHFPKKYKLGTIGDYGLDVAIEIIRDKERRNEK